ncbi:MAG: hypothetical protein JNK57_03015 [Planctomycetaceae bacterium]|nr:hypothetical protein [Planctomycetaceae bacterium]
MIPNRILLLSSVFILSLFTTGHGSVQAQDWFTAGSYYTHNPQTNVRVHQFAANPVVLHTPDPFMSVYRQQRSSITVGGSSDNYHKVYQFGDVVRPYGEWERPYRPYSVPYSDWAYGSPFGHLASPPRTNPMLPSPIYAPGFFPTPYQVPMIP